VLPIPTELPSASGDLGYYRREAQMVFARLAPLIAARYSMRLWAPDLRAFRDRAQQLTRTLPGQPAAVPLYARDRARLIALDFDAKHHSGAAVEQDVRLCLAWLRECGGRTIIDRSTSGGQHVLIPLPLGTTVTRAEIEPVLRVLAVHLPTLDITPMLNPRTGCITPPGSACREGGYRRLVGPLEDAVDALTTRSDRRFLAQLQELLGITRPVDRRAHPPIGDRAHCAPRTQPSPTACAPTTAPDLWEGSGDHTRLRAHFRCHTPMPRAVRAFAVSGTAPQDHRWRAPDGRLDRSEARQSILVAAVLRGYTLADVHTQLPPAGGSWAGFWASYDRYGRGAPAALRRDWTKACDWAARNAPEFLPAAHKIPEHTGGWRGEPPRARKQTEWLAAATMWVDAQWPGSPRRHTILALLQGLAHASVVAGAIVRGVPVVEVGGRSLSIMACLSETTVWQLLRDLRDLPGSPILRTRRGAGILADQYALVPPSINGRRLRPDPIDVQRARVESVHEAWSVLGLHCRRFYEAVAHHNLATPADVIAAAKMSRSAGYSALATLTTTGLLNHQHGRITVGPVHLDSIAFAHGLPQVRRERIARHKCQRAAWHEWLLDRFGLHTTTPAADHQPPVLSAHTESANAQLVHANAASAHTHPRVPADCTDQRLAGAENHAASNPRNTYPLGTHIGPPTDRGRPQVDRTRCAHCAHSERTYAHLAREGCPAPP
jgi:hypothetical protein